MSPPDGACRLAAVGHRLSRIVTRTGDAGDTGLTGGARVPKTHPRVRAMGDVDELNSQLGVLLAQKLPGDLRATLTRIQHELFNLGGELSLPGSTLVTGEHLHALERDVETLNRTLPPLKEFVLPGGTPAAAAPGARHLPARGALRVAGARSRTAESRRAALPQSPVGFPVRRGSRAGAREGRAGGAVAGYFARASLSAAHSCAIPSSSLGVARSSRLPSTAYSAPARVAATPGLRRQYSRTAVTSSCRV
jgi:cob(I)alamin adenosyltransferase